ncbi:MAG TPA: PAS domain S-box protein, partial [Pyrinomonadaceae bacterium]|nr:PAS domain S-box protein [Pyrinomonadaceae bacterium]
MQKKKTDNESYGFAVAERRRTDEWLQESEAMLKGLLEYASEAVMVVNSAGRIERVNRLALQMFGYSDEELADLSVEVLLPDRFRSAHERHCAGYASEPQIRQMGTGLELFGKRKDGSELPVDIMLSPMEISGKRVVTATIRDITERKCAEEARSRLASIVESSDDAIFSETLDGIVTSWNSGAERLFGYMAEDMIGRSIRVTVPPDCEDEVHQTLAAIRQGRGVRNYESVRVTKKGTRCDVAFTASPINDARGKTTGVSVIVRDITERKKAEERLAHEASHDALTGLPNRALFMEHLRQAIARSKRHEDYLFAVLFLDLDRFKV